MKTGPKPKRPIERFMQKIKKTDSCWEWTAGKNSHHYGCFRIGSLTDGSRKQVLAHRWSYEHFIGSIPEGLFVCHKCDNPSCVNPAHFFLGTNSDNIRDCISKGLFGTRDTRGVKNGRAKLTEGQVLEIRDKYPSCGTMASLAGAYGVTKTQISWIINRKSWAHI